MTARAEGGGRTRNPNDSESANGEEYLFKGVRKPGVLRVEEKKDVPTAGLETRQALEVEAMKYGVSPEEASSVTESYLTNRVSQGIDSVIAQAAELGIHGDDVDPIIDSSDPFGQLEKIKLSKDSPKKKERKDDQHELILLQDKLLASGINVIDQTGNVEVALNTLRNLDSLVTEVADSPVMDKLRGTQITIADVDDAGDGIQIKVNATSDSHELKQFVLSAIGGNKRGESTGSYEENSKWNTVYELENAIEDLRVDLTYDQINNPDELIMILKFLKQELEMHSQVKAKLEGKTIEIGSENSSENLQNLKIRPDVTLDEFVSLIENMSPNDAESRQPASPERTPEAGGDEPYNFSPELEAARKEYVRYQKLMKGKIKRSEREELEKKYSDAKILYEFLREKHIGSEILKALEEKQALEAERLEKYSRGEPGRIEKFGQWFREHRKTRLAATGLLLGAGLFFGAGTAVGMAAIVGRRGLSGFGAGIGTTDLIRNLRDRSIRKKAEKLDDRASLGILNEAMQKLNMRAYYDGKKPEEDPLYTKLSALWEAKLSSDMSEQASNLNVQEAVNLLQQQLDAEDNEFEYAYAREKTAKKVSLTAGVLVGAVIYSGALAKALGNATSWGSEPSPVGVTTTPETPPLPPPPVLETAPPIEAVDPPSASTIPEIPVTEVAPESHVTTTETFRLEDGTPLPTETAPVETAAETTIEPATIDVTSRGIEGTILDLKEADPDKYGKIIEWLHSQDPDFKGSDGGLVHRYVEHFAQEHGYNIDQGGGQDLSRIFGAEIQINADGSLNLNPESIDLMPEQIEPNTVSDAGEIDSPKDAVPSTEAMQTEPSIDTNLPEPEADGLKSLNEELNPDSPTGTRGLDATVQEPLTSLEEVPDTEPSVEVSEVQQARDVAANSVEKASTAIQLVYGEGYRDFLEDTFRLSTGNLDKVQALKIDGFMDWYENQPDRVQGNFSRLKEYIETVSAGRADYIVKLNNKTVREFVIETAKIKRGL